MPHSGFVVASAHSEDGWRSEDWGLSRLVVHHLLVGFARLASRLEQLLFAALPGFVLVAEDSLLDEEALLFLAAAAAAAAAVAVAAVAVAVEAVAVEAAEAAEAVAAVAVEARLQAGVPALLLLRLAVFETYQRIVLHRHVLSGTHLFLSGIPSVPLELRAFHPGSWPRLGRRVSLVLQLYFPWPRELSYTSISSPVSIERLRDYLGQGSTGQHMGRY